MDKKLLRQIAEGEEKNEDIDFFDEMAFSGFQKDPSKRFTAKVMKSLPSRPGRSINYQVWGIIVGFMVAVVLWGMEGFALPNLTVAVDYFGLSKSLEVSGILKGFMMINTVLVLLLIDRAVQRRKRAI